MATAAQLKALRKKHHLGEFSRRRKVYKHNSPVRNMARRRKSYSRKRRSYGGSGMKGVWSSILGVGVYVLFENYMERYIPLQEPILSLAELGVGYWLSRKSGMVGDIGKAAVYVNVYQLMKYFLGNLGGLGGSSPQVTSMFAYN